MGVQRAYRGGFDGRPGWWIAFDFNEDRIEALKRAIPYTQRAWIETRREWIETRREWWIAEAFEDQLCTLVPGFEAFLRQGSLF